MSEKKEYITKDEAISAIHTGFWTDIRIDKNIQAIPAADVEPVVRGEWIETKFYGVNKKPILICSICEDEIEETKLRRALKRCPNCGAHMERSGSGE